jgi:ribosomal protein S6
VHIAGLRAHWGVIKEVDRDVHTNTRIIRVLWMNRPGTENWMWASEMRLIEKEPSK